MTPKYQNIAPGFYVIPKQGAMRVPGLVVATDELLARAANDRSIDQVINVATLPGIVKYSIAMPDIHWGYGFPIGGVAAMDMREGVISPGGVGYDINCGVRVAFISAPFDSIDPKTADTLLAGIFNAVPCGVGSKHKGERLSRKEYREMLQNGARWAIERGMGTQDDLAHIESGGALEDADPDAVSATAKERGHNQLGTLGSGNHFIEIGDVARVFEPNIADAWGIDPGGMYLMIHSGSRGLGHQVCQDTIRDFVAHGYADGLPDRQLVAAPIASDDGRAYYRAMCAAANFAFCNRQLIMHYTRRVFEHVLGVPGESVRLLYDLCHNIAKIETHDLDGTPTRLMVHRKGATRAFGPGHPDLAPVFQASGQPVIVPGDMGRASYVLVGTGHPDVFASACHGAGRAMSRKESSQHWKNKDPIASIESDGIRLLAASRRTVAEEMPLAYKDVTQVVAASENAGIARSVLKLRPRMVIKG